MSKYPLSLYLLPFILLLIIIVFIRSSGDSGVKKVEKPAIDEKKASDVIKNEEKTESGLPFESRIPIYPNSEKVALQEGADVKEAAFFATTDPIDMVKDWYVDKLGGYNKVNLIDIVNKDKLRVITVSLPDPPKELVEIKEKFKGAKDLLITITTVSFYTRNQPRPIEYEPTDREKSGKEETEDNREQQDSGDESND